MAANLKLSGLIKFIKMPKAKSHILSPQADNILERYICHGILLTEGIALMHPSFFACSCVCNFNFDAIRGSFLPQVTSSFSHESDPSLLSLVKVFWWGGAEDEPWCSFEILFESLCRLLIFVIENMKQNHKCSKPYWNWYSFLKISIRRISSKM